ncbi:inorganic phosphate transporter [Thorsellia kenyensis]|uniref:Phosphate transporter n=1 Tax=Thorsellia kenyensis TaxID=1549888 RepID=A0ABV6CHQ5_9GAMM
MFSIFSELDLVTIIFLFLALGLVLFYEAVNGFHDTANAVATVIYTRAMTPYNAVIMAGIFNFLGVILGGLSVAYAIVHLFPNEVLLNIGSKQGILMMLSLLVAALTWNLGTWYFGIPASSSHTLIGSIVGVALGNAIFENTPMLEAINISKVTSIGLSLIISPLVGMVLAGGLLFFLLKFWNTKKRRRIHMTPEEREKKYRKKKPPFWTRISLIGSAIGVSYVHGSNDGQKGIGLVMLALIAIAPSVFVVNLSSDAYQIQRTHGAIYSFQDMVARYPNVLISKEHTDVTVTDNETRFVCDINPSESIELSLRLLDKLPSYTKLTSDERIQVRRALICIDESMKVLLSHSGLTDSDRTLLSKIKKEDLLITIEYAPVWVIISVALALGIGTMIGWRRVVVTIGEKIGKQGMTYAQGFSAQLTAAVSIGIASQTGMPVSTTHVLSSAVAGTMIAGGGGVQSKTVKTIFMAWVLTLPVTVLLSGGLYLLAINIF